MVMIDEDVLIVFSLLQARFDRHDPDGELRAASARLEVVLSELDGVPAALASIGPVAAATDEARGAVRCAIEKASARLEERAEAEAHASTVACSDRADFEAAVQAKVDAVNAECERIAAEEALRSLQTSTKVLL